MSAAPGQWHRSAGHPPQPLAANGQVDDREVGVVAEVADDHAIDAPVEVGDDVASRSCVIGRGVETFSICSAMALASGTPTQIGSTPLALLVLEDDDGRARHRVDHQAL